MSIIGSVLEDVTTDVLGKIGAWQCWVTFLSTSLLIPCFFRTNEDIFLLHPSEYSCIPPENTIVYNLTRCTMIIQRNGTDELLTCDKWYIKFLWIIWLKKNWVIFCEDQQKLLSNAIICRLGNIFGSIILGLFADNFGRRKCILLSLSAVTGLTLMVLLCNSRSWYQLLVFLKSLFEGAILYMGITLTCEIASNAWRARLVTISMIPRILSTMYMIPLANTLPNLETYYCIGFIIGCGLLLAFKSIPESPHWLLFNRKIHKAETLLWRAAVMNKVKLCSRFSIRPVNQRAYLALDASTTCIEVMNNKNIRAIIFIMIVFWGLFSFQWSSLYVLVHRNYDNANYFLIEILCFMLVFGIVEFLVLAKLKKKHLLLLNIFVTGAFCCSKALQGQLNDSTVKFLLSVPMASGLLAQIILLEMTPRFFAINIRCTFLGCCHAAASVGTIIGYLVFIYEVANHLATLILDVTVMLVLAGLCLAFPDIDGRELPDVLEDMDYFSDLTKPLRWAMVKTDRLSLEEVELRVYSFGSNVVETTERVPARPIGTNMIQWMYNLWNMIPSFRK